MSLNRKCVMLEVTNKSYDDLVELSSSCGLDISVNYNGDKTDHFGYHCTLFCTENEVDYPNLEFYLPKKITLSSSKIGKLGDFATVLFLNDQYNEVNIMRKQMLDEMKAIPTFENLIPHVSLSYAPTDKYKEEQSLYYTVIFDRMTIKDFNPK